MAFVMLALWLPASVHCGIEALPGGEILSCDAVTTDHDHPPCESDACAIVEDGRYRPTYEILDVGPPVSWLCDTLICTTSATSMPGPVSGSVVASRDGPAAWTRDWVFVRRAAAPPRAPSLIA